VSYSIGPAVIGLVVCSNKLATMTTTIDTVFVLNAVGYSENDVLYCIAPFDDCYSHPLRRRILGFHYV